MRPFPYKAILKTMRAWGDELEGMPRLGGEWEVEGYLDIDKDNEVVIGGVAELDIPIEGVPADIGIEGGLRKLTDATGLTRIRMRLWRDPKDVG